MLRLRICFDVAPRLAHNEESKVKAFRKVRDELRERLHLWILNQRKLLRERDTSAA